MKALVVGGGGREHALAWKLAQSPRVERVYVAPGNAGTAAEPGIENVPVPADDAEALLDFARRSQVDLTVVGPEGPLVAGLVDRFEEAGLSCLGPSRAAARLEGSKAFTKDFMTRWGIPTAGFAAFDALGPALEYVQSRALPLVIKADGLAAGKGVTIAADVDEAAAALHAMLEQGVFGAAGSRVVVEDFIAGEEASFICLVDGEHVVPMASSQDHKPRDDGDRGPNTGGMGAYSPAPVVTPEIHQRVLDEVIRPTVHGLAVEGTPYRGFLYAGVMIAPDGGIQVLEYNCRFGDPEAQPVLLRLRSDFAELCLAAVRGGLDQVGVQWDPRAALGVVLAAGGYPGQYAKGDPIAGLDADLPDTKIFHAGTRLDPEGQVLTSGGRVLCVCALGETVAEAQQQAYARADRIAWSGMYCRRDIGHRAVARERGE